MEELLIKMNFVKKHNKILRLKRMLEEEENANIELLDEYKKTLIAFDQKISDINNNLCSKLESLKDENQKLKEDIIVINMKKEFYERQVTKIPKFILKFFSGDAKLLEGEKGSGKK